MRAWFKRQTIKLIFAICTTIIRNDKRAAKTATYYALRTFESMDRRRFASIKSDITTVGTCDAYRRRLKRVHGFDDNNETLQEIKKMDEFETKTLVAWGGMILAVVILGLLMSFGIL